MQMQGGKMISAKRFLTEEISNEKVLRRVTDRREYDSFSRKRRNRAKAKGKRIAAIKEAILQEIKDNSDAGL